MNAWRPRTAFLEAASAVREIFKSGACSSLIDTLVAGRCSGIGLRAVLSLAIGSGDMAGFVGSFRRPKLHSEVVTGVEPGLQCGWLVPLRVGNREHFVVACIVSVCRHADHDRLKSSSIRVEDANDFRVGAQFNQLEHVFARSLERILDAKWNVDREMGLLVLVIGSHAGRERGTEQP
jgi:hypothetical protein